MFRAGLAFAILMIIVAGCAAGEGKTVKAEPRIEITDVFTPGRDGLEYKNYRIPAICVTQEGAILGFAEGRRVASDHNKGPIVCKRSEDGGKTWSKLQIVAEHGRNSLNNPTPVVLPDSGRILLFYQLFPENYHSRAIPSEGVVQVEPGFVGPRVCRTYLVASEDDGRSWSGPREITQQAKRPEPVTSNATGPGVAIVLQRDKYKGRIVVPSGGGGRAYTCYSDDNGQTWKMGQTIPSTSSETQVVELRDGRLMMDVRSRGYRHLAYSSDGGQNWTELKKHPDLPDSGCMGCVVRYDLPDGKNMLLHSGSTTRINGRRSRGAVYMSWDNGKTWPKHRVYHPGSFDYSSMAVLDNGDIGILAEFDYGVKGKFNDLRFVRYNLAWLLEKKLAE